jgi:enamine deaminase RidA (YjgF/YER057c/UK114 family)
MDISRYNPPDIAAPLGQYSHVARVREADFLFIAGQLSQGSDIREQCDGVFASIEAALKSADADWNNVVQFTTYLVDAKLIPDLMKWRLANFPRMFGPGSFPPNTLLVIDQLVDPRFLVEVQTIAAI